MKIQKSFGERQAARESGERYYFTGLPCKNGHIAKRATVSGACVECTDAASKAWKQKNPDQHAKSVSRYRENNKELCRERSRAAMAKKRATNPDAIKNAKKRASAKKAEMDGRTYRPGGFVSEAELKERLYAVHSGAIEYVAGYTTMLSNAVFRCVEHDAEYEAHPHNVLRGANPCTKCNHLRSGMEEEIAAFLEQHTWVERNNRTVIAPKEIDIWLPEFSIGVEFNGLFWHTTNRVGKLHKEKWTLADTAGIRLVQIFEDEWLNKQDILKARLLAFIGKSEKRDARKLELKSVVWKDAKAFLKDTHIQGPGPVGTAYGLYEGELLVAIATFGKSRSGAMTGAKKDGEYEVLRYASVGSVRGGFTRLFAAFKKAFDPECVISYCDLRYGTGGLYKAAGFSLGSITEPDYWWVPKGKVERVSRYSVQKHKMAAADHPLNPYYAPKKTENQICGEAGWEKIHGVGSQKWEWAR